MSASQGFDSKHPYGASQEHTNPTAKPSLSNLLHQVWTTQSFCLLREGLDLLSGELLQARLAVTFQPLDTTREIIALTTDELSATLWCHFTGFVLLATISTIAQS